MSTSGWAIRRNNSCLASIGEKTCQATVENFKACCPSTSYCPSSQVYNAYCCAKSNQNCLQTLVDNGPYCANRSWIPYIAIDGGPFCCDPYEQGYAVGTSDGCAPAGYVLQNQEQYLNPARATIPKDITSKTSNRKAIIGAVVGGVIALFVLMTLIWLFARQRWQKTKQASRPKPTDDLTPNITYEAKHSMCNEIESNPLIEVAGMSHPHEMETRQRRHELESN